MHNSIEHQHGVTTLLKTVERCYNVVQYNRILHTSLQELIKEQKTPSPTWVSWIGLDWICLTTTHVLEDILPVLMGELGDVFCEYSG